MLKVVISHSRKDVEFAKQMTVELQKATWISGSTGRASRPPWIGGWKSKKGSKRLGCARHHHGRGNPKPSII
jgi:hypothetical protein